MMPVSQVLNSLLTRYISAKLIIFAPDAAIPDGPQQGVDIVYVKQHRPKTLGQA